MSDTLTLTGQLAIAPDSTAEADLSGDFAIKVPFSETLTLSRKDSRTIVLDDTSPLVVNVSTIGSIHALVIRTSAAITATLTSASGAAQVIPVNGLFVLLTETIPITAISLTAASSAVVQLTMGRV
jgi:hypothetical protein